MAETDRSGLVVQVAPGIASIAASDWDGCAHAGADGAGSTAGQDGLDPRNPFVSQAFLSALEDAGTVGGRTGWQPVPLLVRDPAGTLLAAAPSYLKSHSQGEYVFDHGWADAYAQAGGRYYPKLQVSVPFTPATGPRLLVRPGPQADGARATLIAALQALRGQAGASSIHLTFLPKDEWDALGRHGFLQRIDRQFHWINEGYGDFEDFLGALASRKRKVIRRERREAVSAGISIERLCGAAITPEHWDAFYAFYLDTGSRKWGRPYLNRRFFALIGERMAERIVLIMAKRGGRYVAGAINFLGADALYGRNWGCIEEHPFLHFEICYYQAIEEAISRGLKRVEAGAQGEHKLARGYRPVPTFSAHDLADPALKRAVADYLGRERAYIAETQRELAALMPFRRTTIGESE
jgi:uncharacterized protein